MMFFLVGIKKGTKKSGEVRQSFCKVLELIGLHLSWLPLSSACRFADFDSS